MSDSRRCVLVCAAAAGTGYLLFVKLSPSDVIGPEPELGFDESPADYDAAQYPDALLVTLPRFSAAEMPWTPLIVTFPEVPTGRPIAITGEIEHPNTAIVASLVRMSFYEGRRDDDTDARRRGVLQEFAKGEGGRLTYLVEGHVPRDPGVYNVQIEVRHPILDENIEELPVEERMTLTLIAEGQIVITN